MKITIILALSTLLAFGAKAATINAASTSLTDVQTAINSASTGDTVQLPTGTSHWTAAISLTKSITILGNGTANTKIFNDTTASQGLETPVFDLKPGDNQLMRVSAITFEDNNDAMTADGIDIDPTVLPTKVQIDNCVFTGFSFAVKNQTAFGVCYSCTFNNNNVSTRNQGFFNTASIPSSYSFTVPAWGTQQYFVWEDDTFNFTNWGGGKNSGNYMGDTEYPANYMIRHCTFNIARNAAVVTDGFDMHGTGGCQTPSNTTLNGFAPIIHDNNWVYTNNETVCPSKMLDIRGGNGCLFYNNTGSGCTGNIQIRADPGSSQEPLNTYFWNNTQAGSSDSISSITGSGGTSAPVLNTNYFTREAYYSEMPYPHPLRGVKPQLLPLSPSAH